MSSFPTQIADIGGYQINYVDVGVSDGTPVVLIHGLAGSHRSWLDQIQWLSKAYRVIALDNRGAGLSTQLDEPVTTQDLARDVMGLLDHLKIDSAHFLGRSMGGAALQHVALMAPQKVRSMVLCATFARLDPLGRRVLSNMSQVLEWRQNWQDMARHGVQHFVSTDFFNHQPEQVQRVEAILGGEIRLPACFIRQQIACQDHDTTDHLHHISQPTLIMAGTHDPICSLETTHVLSHGIPGAQTILFDKASHFFFIESPEKFNRELQAWLQNQA